MREQLENGIRFIDFRITRTAPPKGEFKTSDWYSLHLVESNNKALAYMQQAKEFMDTHPNEVITLWLSRHGEICKKGTDQFPGSSVAERQAFWGQIKDTFGDLLFDRDAGARLNETTLAGMVAKGQRVVLYVSDYAEFTGNDTKAYDACANLRNDLECGHLDNLPGAVNEWKQAFLDAPANQRKGKSEDTMWLTSLAGSPPDDQLKYAAILKYDAGIDAKKTREACAALFKIPNMTDWCPYSLLDNEQMRAYYLQLAMDTVVHPTTSAEIGFPGAIYLDAVDLGGKIRMGTTILAEEIGDGAGNESSRASAGSAPGSDTQVVGYGYVDALLLHNTRKACKETGRASANSKCPALLQLMEERMEQNPLYMWEDVAHGRNPSWLGVQ
jgi:hypothetical protein